MKEITEDMYGKTLTVRKKLWGDEDIPEEELENFLSILMLEFDMKFTKKMFVTVLTRLSLSDWAEETNKLDDAKKRAYIDEVRKNAKDRVDNVIVFPFKGGSDA